MVSSLEETEFHSVHDAAVRAGGSHVRACQVDKRLPVGRSRGVEVHEMAHTVVRAIRGTGDHHAAIAMADENDVTQVLEVEQLHDDFDVAIEIDTATEKMLPLTQPGQRWGANLVSLGPQQGARRVGQVGWLSMDDTEPVWGSFGLLVE